MANLKDAKLPSCMPVQYVRALRKSGLNFQLKTMELEEVKAGHDRLVDDIKTQFLIGDNDSIHADGTIARAPVEAVMPVEPISRKSELAEEAGRSS